MPWTTFGKLLDSGARALLDAELLLNDTAMPNTMARLGCVWPTSYLLSATDVSDTASALRNALNKIDFERDFGEQYVELGELFSSISSIVTAIIDFGNRAKGVAPDIAPSNITDRILALLICERMCQDAPVSYSVLSFLGLISTLTGDFTNTLSAYRCDIFNWQGLLDLGRDPTAVFRSRFGWGTAEGLRFASLLAEAERMLVAMGIPAGRYEPPTEVVQSFYGNTADAEPPRLMELRIPLYQFGTEESGLIELALGALPVPDPASEDLTPRGLAFILYLSGAPITQFPIGARRRLQLTGCFRTGSTCLVTPSGTILPGVPISTMEANASVSLVSDASSTPDVVVNIPGLRFEIASYSVTAGFDTLPEVGIKLELQGRASLGAGDADGFISNLLRGSGTGGAFDLALGWSSNRGLCFHGSGSLRVEILIHEDVGPISVDSVIINLALDGGAEFILTSTFWARLGPVTARVKEMGILLPIVFRDDNGGNLGPLDASGLRFVPPTGAGLSVDTGAVIGGGFLEFDQKKQQYSGALALKCGEIALSAIGIITTKMPDGGDDYSLLISICATFTPSIQLSFGFTLSGVGGLIGVNRRMDVEALRTGLKAGTLGSILFPDPETLIPNAARIISDMGTAFPVQEGRYVVGPMVKLGWGSPNIITADVGIFLELPEPVKAVILGQLEAILPEKTNPQIVIRLDVLGVLEFSKRQLTFQAALYDSTVMGYPVSGDSAFLLGWGDDPRFALSLGGFHPRFTAPEPPTVFANLRRLSIDICANSSLHLTCAAYQAFTPNSLQFGAQLDLHAEKAGAKLTGHLGFDTLIYFSPFSFDVTMNAKVKISYEGETFAAIEMTLCLSGPRPWVGRVKAKIKLLFITVPIKFTVKWGDETPISIPAVDPWEDVQRVLQLRESWSSSLPVGKTMVEVLRGDMVQDEQLVLHPLGRLEVRQKVPLGMVLSRASSAPITGHNRFEIESVMVGDYEINKSNGLVPVEEFFARGQWEDLGDRALSVPSFEKMQAGVAVSTGAVQICGTTVSIDSEYETVFIEGNRSSSPLGRYTVPKSTVAGVLDARIKRDARRRAGPQSRFVCKPSAFTVLEEGYSVADADSVTRSDKTTAQRISRTKADQLLCASRKANTAKTRFVVPDYEMAL